MPNENNTANMAYQAQKVQNICMMCPPSNEEPFFFRILHRICFLLALLFLYPLNFKNRWVSGYSGIVAVVLLFLPVVAACIVYEPAKLIVVLGVRNMKTVGLALITVVFIMLSVYLVAEKPEWHNPLVDMLFSVILCTVSIGVGLSLNKRLIAQEATNHWMPAAESACKDLITIQATVSRLQNSHNRVCSQLEKFLPPENKEPLKALLESKCTNCGNQLATVIDHLHKAVQDWEVFLS